MHDHLSEGLARVGLQLSEEVLSKEICFLEELLRWNQRINLTSIRNRNEAIEKHIIDSLLVLPHLDAAKQVVDMGSGGGLPGIPLAIAEPGINVVSIDSVGKKVNFQKHIKRLLQLDNFSAKQSRIEISAAPGMEHEKHDLIISRAFTSLEAYFHFALPWLKPGGRVLAMKGPEGREELDKLGRTLQASIVEPLVIDYVLPFSTAARQIIIIKKLEE